MDSMPEINVSPSKSAAGSTTASFKAAGSLVAKKAERTKLVTVTLPRAYADLGKSVYKDDALRAGFAELFKGIDELLAQRKQINEAGKARPSGNGLADKARKAAADATDMAKSKAIDLQAFQAFAKLGEAVYQQHKDDPTLADAIKPIAIAVSRRDQLDRDTASIQKDSKGHWLTPKRIAWGVGIFIGLGVLGSILDPDKKGGGGDGGPAETDSPSAEQSETITASGNNFSDKEMEVFYKKAAQLQLGMSAKDVVRIMGQPPTKQKNFDPYKDLPANLRKHIVDPRVVVTYSWCSAKDPENAFVSVSLKEGEADWISAHRGRGTTVLDKKR